MNAEAFERTASSASFGVISRNGEVSGAELARMAGELTLELAQYVKPGPQSLVAICTSSSENFFVAYLAASSLGATTALVGNLQDENTQLGLTELDPDLWIYDRANRDQKPGCASFQVHASSPSRRTLDVDRAANPEHRPWSSVASSVDAAGPLILFRTSGTTGHARWVLHQEDALWASVRSRVEGSAEELAVLEGPQQYADLLASLANGLRACTLGLHTISGFGQLLHCLYLGMPFLSLDGLTPKETIRVLSERQAASLISTPRMLRIMNALSRRKPEAYKDLRLIGIGGGGLHPEVARDIENRFEARIVQGYGSTEVAGGVTSTRFYDSADVRLTTVGHVYPGVEVSIDPAGESTTSGEICVRAPDMLALGYIEGDHAEPLLVPLERRGDWLRTGDVGELRSDGNMVIHGRADQKLQHRDVTFYPEEVEVALEAHPDVEGALVYLRATGPRNVLAATCSGSPGLTASELRAWCVRLVGQIKAPEVFEFASLNMTSTGKTKRAKVPQNAVRKTIG